MVYTIELLNDNALRLLRDLEQLNIIRFVRQEVLLPMQRPSRNPKKAFEAIQIDTRGFKFNRDEANER